ncbi:MULTISPECIES: hypothetical protein [Streptomyces]|uniref:Lipoprotein n=1 Tax=Streptomyces doudnae TaxID=3075536 RepID=A0ABD5F0X4_9ACTN|nr:MULTISPECIES: hypothetical protein [unclassified Streptomyces]MDT0440254.1 hypothetical protein [Streptomyces sp. DSM 41981]MYQ63180.1 hypothetical protein [Streptomyces sp. SID4950]SCD52693.1 hypothetical protein GA0115242_10759 [Streptomyces sp. SolWspMP-5a-2]
MTDRHLRRTARSAGLLAVAAVAALSLTACQSGGKDAANGAETSRATGTGPEVSASAPASPGTGAARDPGNDRTAAQTAGRGAVPSGTPATAAVRTETLVDGSKAEIRRLGQLRYQAKIIDRGAVVAELDTADGDAGLDANGMYVVLTRGGDLRSWMGGEHRGPGTFTLAGGWKAKVTKVGELHYRAQIIGREGAVEATMEANQHDTGLDANAVYIVLSTGGVISSHA